MAHFHQRHQAGQIRLKVRRVHLVMLPESADDLGHRLACGEAHPHLGRQRVQPEKRPGMQIKQDCPPLCSDQVRHLRWQKALASRVHRRLLSLLSPDTLYLETQPDGLLETD